MSDPCDFCFYCGDAKVQPTWVFFGGTIGKRYYICHRKRCQKAHAVSQEKRKASLAKYRAELAARKAAKGAPMLRADLKVGGIYVIAGRGEMLLASCPATGSLGFRGHGGGSYWAGPEDVVREASRADLEARDAQARPRGVACDDPECWCRKVPS